MPYRRKVAATVPALALAAALCVAGCSSGPSQLADPHRSGGTATSPRVVAGHTVIVLAPVTLDGSTPTQADLDSSADVLVKRFVAAGLPAPAVTSTPAHGLQLDLGASITGDQIGSLVTRGALTFRTVLSQTQAVQATASVPAPAGPPGDDATLLAQVQNKVGDAYALAASLTEPPVDQDTIDTLAPFGKLSPAEVAVLPTEIQFNVPTVSCAQLDRRSPIYTSDVRYLTRQVTACDSGGVKYLLDAAALGNADLAGAEAKYDATTYGGTGGWYVEIKFTPSGQPKWTSYTASQINNQVGIVLDGSVLVAPS
ncbi:MAG TPA: hypothetical protein VKB69_04845, partial [Micromonosporaceae bacterium]|nr:hypothetical protein [Micromonosporaceae bacterium]